MLSVSHCSPPPNAKFGRIARADKLHQWLVKTSLACFVLIFFAGTGCRITPHCCDSQPVLLPDTNQKTSLPGIKPDETTPIRLPFLKEPEKGLIPKGITEVYPLTIRECEYLAAQNAPLARVLEGEANGNDICHACDRVDPCVLDAANQAVLTNSAYQRNLAAEKALLAYFGLVEVYLQNQIIEETIVEIDELKEVLTQLQSEGLLLNVDPELLTRKRLDAESQRNELLFNFERLNASLRALLGLRDSIHPIWPDCNIEQFELPSDLQVEIQSAMQNRADIQAMEQLAMTSNDQLLETLRGSVRSVSPFAGLVLEKRLFGGLLSDNSCEINKLRSQLMVLKSAQTDLVKADVSEQYYAVHKSHEQVQLETKRMSSLTKSENRLDAKRQVQPIEVDEVLSVKAGILETRSAIVHEATELQRSWIKLKSSQGLLGRITSK